MASMAGTLKRPKHNISTHQRRQRKQSQILYGERLGIQCHCASRFDLHYSNLGDAHGRANAGRGQGGPVSDRLTRKDALMPGAAY